MPGLTVPQNFPYPTYEEANDAPAQIQALANAINFALVTTQNQITAGNNRHRAQINSGVNQSIPNNAYTNMVFANEEFDNDNMVNLGVDNTLITATTAGIYLLSAQLIFPNNTVGNRAIRFIGAGTNAGGIQTETVNAEETMLSASMLFNALAGNTLRVQAYQNSGGALNVSFRRFSAVRLSG